VRVSRRYLKNNTRIRYGQPRHRLVLTIVLLVGLSVAGYICFVPVITGNIGGSQNGRSHLADIERKASLSPDTDDPLGAQDSESAQGSVEIAGLTGQGDTLLSLLSTNIEEQASAIKVASSLASVIQSSLDKPKAFTIETELKPDRYFSITTDKQGRFLRAIIEMDPAHVFRAIAKGDAVKCWQEDVVLDFKVETLTFKLKHTLIYSVLAAGESKELADKLDCVFRWDIDFHMEPRNGDTCKVLFERRYADDRPAGYGRILYAVYEGQKTGKKTGVLFNGKYYNDQGVQLEKDFLRTPLKRLKVTSRYGKRFHPILKRWRRHKGVDYGAPRGTPVRSVANGTVVFSGWAKGYGKYIRIQHKNGYETRYGHLSRRFVKKGERVKQGKTIGLVGATGLATGPHLDFQILVNGEHRNPLKVKMIKTLRKVPSPLMTRFAQVTQTRLGEMNDPQASIRMVKRDHLTTRR
jgi:murein DD-endopeptidase MepM/ murein hydrolase activator NlpD